MHCILFLFALVGGLIVIRDRPGRGMVVESSIGFERSTSIRPPVLFVFDDVVVVVVIQYFFLVLLFISTPKARPFRLWVYVCLCAQQ